MSGLLELAARCEAAEGGNTALDLAIAEALGWTLIEDDDEIDWLDPHGKQHPWYPFWTRSLDAAMTLVPEGWYVASLTQDHSGWWAGLCPTNAPADYKWQGGWAPTPTAALALCAAALRARASNQGDAQ